MNKKGGNFIYKNEQIAPDKRDDRASYDLNGATKHEFPQVPSSLMRDPAQSLFHRRRFWNKTNVSNLTSEYFALKSLDAFIIKTIRLQTTVVLHRSPPKDLNQENWSCTHFCWFKSRTWSRVTKRRPGRQFKYQTWRQFDGTMKIVCLWKL